MDAEISSFVRGRALSHPENGETIDIKATVRKAHLTFKRD